MPMTLALSGRRARGGLVHASRHGRAGAAEDLSNTILTSFGVSGLSGAEAVDQLREPAALFAPTDRLERSPPTSFLQRQEVAASSG